VLEGAKEVRQIEVNHGLYLMPKEMLMKRTDRIVTAAARSESLGAVQKQRLLDALKHLLHHLLHDSILKGTDAQRSGSPPGLPSLGIRTCRTGAGR
jgi:hypothetical protein